MSTELKREERYLVFKLSDVEEHFTPGEKQQLARLAEVQRVGRSESGKPLLECVVVESDWPEYEPTWKAIETRVTGAQAQPAPSVPERITHDQAPHVYSQEAAEGYADGWNACVKKIVAAAPQNCIKAAMEAQREGCAEIVLQAAHKAADCNNLRDYELLRALSIEVAKAPEVKP